MNTLRIKRAFKRYSNGTWAVKGATFDIRNHELVVVTGPSGCGKTTLLRLVAGLETVTDGDIVLAGQVVTDADPGTRNMATVFLNDVLCRKTAMGHDRGLASNRLATTKPRCARNLRQAADILGITACLGRDAKLLLLDDPLSHLDTQLRAQMRRQIKRLQRSLGVAAIYATQDPTEAMALADRIVIMHKGRVEQTGTPAEIYANPASLSVAKFIGTPSMNLLPAEVSDFGMHIGGYTIPFHSSHRGRLTVGLRPERMRLHNGGPGLQVVIDVVEELGTHRLLHGWIGEHALIMSQDVGLPIPRGRMTLNLRRDDMHFFDPETGCRVRLDHTEHENRPLTSEEATRYGITGLPH